MGKDANRFIKRQIAKQNAVSTGFILLDRAFKIPLRTFTLIRGESQAGASAVCLEAARALTELGIPVVYFNPDQSAFSHRLRGIDMDLFLLVQAPEIEPILDIANQFSSERVEAVYILDRVDMVPDRLSKGTPEAIAEMLRRVDNRATVIVADRNRRWTSNLWSFVVEIGIKKIHYSHRVRIGHEALVKGPYGDTTVYISHTSGRISPAYEKAVLEVEAGKNKTTLFEYRNIRAKGFWNFIEQASQAGL